MWHYEKYHYFSVQINSVSRFLYDCSNISYLETDCEFFFELLKDELYDEFGIDVDAKILMEGKLSRIDVRKDIYFSRKTNLKAFINQIGKDEMGYASVHQTYTNNDNYKEKETECNMNSGKKFTCYDKKLECVVKDLPYDDENGRHCARLEFSFEKNKIKNISKKKVTDLH